MMRLLESQGLIVGRCVLGESDKAISREHPLGGVNR